MITEDDGRLLELVYLPGNVNGRVGAAGEYGLSAAADPPAVQPSAPPPRRRRSRRTHQRRRPHLAAGIRIMKCVNLNSGCRISSDRQGPLAAQPLTMTWDSPMVMAVSAVKSMGIWPVWPMPVQLTTQ